MRRALFSLAEQAEPYSGDAEWGSSSEDAALGESGLKARITPDPGKVMLWVGEVKVSAVQADTGTLR
jgi:hypothetical protein